MCRTAGLLFFFCFSVLMAQAGNRLVVVDHPPFMLTDRGIYLAADFNNWNPGDPNFELHKNDAGQYYIDLPDSLRRFEYKFTQGSWGSVEGDSVGGERPNRLFVDTPDSAGTYRFTILSWQKQLYYRFEILRVPEYTPHDAALYICGNFNNWNPRDETYRLQKQVDGTYRVGVNTAVEVLEFKFTRGSWESVEGDRRGSLMPNRRIRRNVDKAIDIFPIVIESWEDFSGIWQVFSFYEFWMLMAAVVALLLALTIPSIPSYKRRANHWLVFITAFIAVALLIKSLANDRSILQAMPLAWLIPQLVWFGLAPAFFRYVEELLFQNRPRWQTFIPLLVQAILYLPLIRLDKAELLAQLIEPSSFLNQSLGLLGGLAWLFNAYFGYRIWHMLDEYLRRRRDKSSYDENVGFIRGGLVLLGACLLLAGLGGLQFFAPTATLGYAMADGMWLALSCFPFLLAYFAISQPESFRLPRAGSLSPDFSLDPSPQKQEVAPPVFADWEKDKARLADFMEKEKPYTNPKLTLGELARQLDLPNHQLSKIINEGYEKNFFDFVNTYRVREFLRNVKHPDYKHYTLLGIAQEAGFNSKSAFNRAFKKVTQKSPSEYLEDE